MSGIISRDKNTHVQSEIIIPTNKKMDPPTPTHMTRLLQTRILGNIMSDGPVVISELGQLEMLITNQYPRGERGERPTGP